MFITKNAGRYFIGSDENSLIQDPGKIKNSKQVKGINGYGKIIGMILEIFNKAVSVNFGDKTYHFNCESLKDFLQRVNKDRFNNDNMKINDNEWVKNVLEELVQNLPRTNKVKDQPIAEVDQKKEPEKSERQEKTPKTEPKEAGKTEKKEPEKKESDKPKIPSDGEKTQDDEKPSEAPTLTEGFLKNLPQNIVNAESSHKKWKETIESKKTPENQESFKKVEDLLQKMESLVKEVRSLQKQLPKEDAGDYNDKIAQLIQKSKEMNSSKMPVLMEASTLKITLIAPTVDKD